MPAAGANEGTYRFCTQYIFRTVAVGAVPTVLNQELAHLVRAEGHSAQASFGVAKKIDMLSYAIATGMSQGVLPLTGYNYSSKNYRRMKSAIKVNFFISFAVALVGTVFLFTCAGPIVRAFIGDEETVRFGQMFQRIICITGPCISVTMLAITSFQSVGRFAS